MIEAILICALALLPACKAKQRYHIWGHSSGTLEEMKRDPMLWDCEPPTPPGNMPFCKVCRDQASGNPLTYVDVDRKFCEPESDHSLALPAANFIRPAIISYYAAKSEQERLEDFLHKNNPGADVFITPKGQADKLREHGWERVPFTWRGNEIWIQRKPRSDQKLIQTSA